MESEVKKLNKYSNVGNVAEALIKACGNDYNEFDRDFPFEFMKSITSHQLNFDKDNLGAKVTSWLEFTEYLPEQITGFASELANALDHTFTLRHYDGNIYPSIKSNFALLQEKLIKKSNTQKPDWLYLGNTAFTFWLFCIDGKKPERGFLRSANYYDEITLDDGSLENKGLQNAEFCASSDLLEKAKLYSEKKKVPVLLKGRIKDIAEIIFGYLLSLFKDSEEGKSQLNRYNAAELLDFIDGTFQMFEVKIQVQSEIQISNQNEWVLSTKMSPIQNQGE